MGFGPRTAYQVKGFEFKQIHFDDYGKTHFNKRKTNTSSSILIDCATTKNPLCQ